MDVGGDKNRIVGNVFVRGSRPAIVLQGSSNNRVKDNRGCGSPGASLVALESARYDDGSEARSHGNQFSGNRNRGAC